MRRTRATTLRLAAMTATSATVTAACGISHAGTTTGLAPGPTGTPITVGISEPLSGPAQARGFEADGQACLKGYELWASDVNSHGGLLGRPVKLTVLNDKGVPNLDAANYRTLITKDHVDLVLAPFSSLLTAQGAEPATEKLGYALVAGSAGAPSVFTALTPPDHDLFSTTLPVQFELAPFYSWVVKQAGHPLTAAYPMVNDPFADPPVIRARNFLQSHGIKTAYKTGPNGYSANVSSSALAADAKAVAKQRAGIVVLGSVAVPTVQLFMHVFAEQGYTPKMFIATSGPDQGQQFLNQVGTGNAVGMMVPDAWYAGVPYALSHVMVEDYIAKYGGTGSTINADVAESYSAGEVLADAVTATQSTDQKKIIAWLHGNHTMQTVVGPVAFSSVGANKLATNAASVFQWQNPSGGGAPQFVQVLLGQGTVQIKPIYKAALTK